MYRPPVHIRDRRSLLFLPQPRTGVTLVCSAQFIQRGYTKNTQAG